MQDTPNDRIINDAPETSTSDDSAVKTDETVVTESAESSAESSIVDELSAQIATLQEQLLRAHAENDNLRKRQERELSNAYKFATERLIKDILPVVDSLTLGTQAAKENIDKPNSIAQFIEGSEITLKILHETLVRHGVEEINPLGEKFDPEKHEAVSIIPTADSAPNTVTHVAQKGYVLNGRSIRAAQVVVAKPVE